MPLLPWGSGSSLLVTTDEIFSEKSSDLSQVFQLFTVQVATAQGTITGTRDQSMSLC